MKTAQFNHSHQHSFWRSLWLIAPIVLIIATIAILVEKTKLPAKPNIDAYSFQLNLPGTIDQKQAIQREIALYQTQLQQDPNSGMTLASLGNAYWKLGKATGEVSWYLLAEQMAQRSLTALPFENEASQLILAQVAQARHDFKTAQTLVLKILKSKPNSDEARSVLVTCALAAGDLNMAEKEVKRLVDQLPNLSSLTLQALVEEAQGKATTIETFRWAIQTEEVGEIGASALARVLLGRHFYHQGNLDQAEFLYQEALRILPSYPLALIHLAMLQTRREQYSEADRTYDRILSQSQQSTHVYDHTILRGKARLKQLQNQSPDHLLKQAEILLRQDTNASSFGHRRELAQLLLDGRRPAIGHGHQNQDVAEALALMREEIKVRRDSQTYAVLARALMANDRFPEARTAIESALKSGIQHAGIFQQAAKIEQQLGNFDQAKIYKNQAQKVDPSFETIGQMIEMDFRF
jgi:tetratricopeptide (TPR) repeat protein